MHTRAKITPKIHIFPMVPHNKCWRGGGTTNSFLIDFSNTGSQPNSQIASLTGSDDYNSSICIYISIAY